MDTAPDLSLPRLAQFIRQHTHDVCNDLNGIDLEATLLAELAPSGEARESVSRIHGQIRRLAADLRTLSAKFNEPKPTRALYAASELFLIWQDQAAALAPAPTVQWNDALGTEQANVDVAALAGVFRELLANAQAFGTGAPLIAASRVEDGRIIFELRELKAAPVEFADWGGAPFSSVRHGHYGLGLWNAQRTITANGGEMRRRFAQDTMELITTLIFPAA
jgi:hypothetical protein